MSDDRDAIHFPKAETMPSFAIAFMGMMFAHAEFKEQVRELQASIMKTPAKLDVDPKITDGDLGKSRDRPKRMANLIKDRPGLVNDQEEKRIVEILKAAIAPCDRRNFLAHGRWWRFISTTSTIKVRGERKGKPELANYTEEEIREIGIELRTLALDLNEIKRAIENRRGDHDASESDFKT
jgi:hypothetical protein